MDLFHLLMPAEQQPFLNALLPEKRGTGSHRRKIPVLLVTDIGSDVDDTVALLALCGSEALELVGVVTSHGSTRQRAAVARGWLRKLHVPDSRVPVAAHADGETRPCVVPGGSPAPDAAALFPGPAEQLILRLARKHRGNLVIVGIGPLGPLASALRQDWGYALKRVAGIYLQGNAIVEGQGATARLRADAKAFNFREGMDAAETVLSLQRDVPFVFLGKYAAYRVGLSVPDFQSWQQKSLPNFRCFLQAQMDNFRRGNPKLFYKLYGIPEAARHADAWFLYLEKKGQAAAFPYDPLCVLALDSPELFHGIKVGKHLLIGNTEKEHSIPDQSRVHDALISIVGAGARKANL